MHCAVVQTLRDHDIKCYTLIIITWLNMRSRGFQHQPISASAVTINNKSQIRVVQKSQMVYYYYTKCVKGSVYVVIWYRYALYQTVKPINFRNYF